MVDRGDVDRERVVDDDDDDGGSGFEFVGTFYTEVVGVVRFSFSFPPITFL